jgi:transcriptional regulator with XRE-family HTH domain
MKKTIHSVEYTALLRLLRQKRLEAGLTQLQLARALRTSQSFIGKCERGERGERRIDAVELRAFCMAMGMTLAEFAVELERYLPAGTPLVRAK